MNLVTRALKAHVRGGRLVLDEPTNLPEGAEVRVALVDSTTVMGAISKISSARPQIPEPGGPEATASCAPPKDGDRVVPP